jgi:hypothetical protein
VTPEELKTLLDGTGLPVAYHHWDEPPKAPYVTYLYAYSSDLMADDRNYVSVDNWQVELYTAVKDPASEALVEAKLEEAAIPYQKIETYLDSEGLYQILYQIRTM